MLSLATILKLALVATVATVSYIYLIISLMA